MATNSSHVIVMRKRPQWPRDLRPLTCRDCGFESRRRHGCLFAVSDVCYHDGRNLSQWSPTECGMSECDRGNSQMRSRATRDCRAMRKKSIIGAGSLVLETVPRVNLIPDRLSSLPVDRA